MNMKSVWTTLRHRAGLRSILAASITVGCAGVEAPDDAIDPPDTPSTLLARVQMEGGNVAEFWEPSPGFILVAEGGTYPSPPTLGIAAAQTTDTLELYSLIAGDDAAPPLALIEAVDRESQLREAALEARAAGEEPDEIALRPRAPVNRAPEEQPIIAAVDTSECPWSWFDDQFSLQTQGNSDVDSWSYEQRTGTTSYSNDRMSIVLAAACSYRGTVTFDFWTKPTNQLVWQDSPSFTRSVSAGNWYWTLSRAEWWYQYARDIYSEVRNANDDGYHHKGVGCDRKGLTQCAVFAPDGDVYWGE